MKDLTQLMIADVMTKAPRSIEQHQSIDLARQWMDDMKVRHLPVRSGGKLVGILSERDLNLVAGLQRSKDALQTVEDAMISEVRTVTDSRKLKDVAQEMMEHRIGCVLVVGKDESLLGIFTDTDALRILAGQG